MSRRRSFAWKLSLALGLIGTLVAALIPAVQRVRDAASSTADL